MLTHSDWPHRKWLTSCFKQLLLFLQDSSFKFYFTDDGLWLFCNYIERRDHLRNKHENIMRKNVVPEVLNYPGIQTDFHIWLAWFQFRRYSYSPCKSLHPCGATTCTLDSEERVDLCRHLDKKGAITKCERLQFHCTVGLFQDHSELASLWVVLHY